MGRFSKMVLLAVVTAALALAARVRAADPPDDDDGPLRVRAEVDVLRRDVKELAARVRQLERLLESQGAVRPAGPAEITEELGIALAGMPKGGLGAESILKLPELLLKAASAKDPAASLQDVAAFGELGFLVPEATWRALWREKGSELAFPTRGELDLGFGGLRALGAEARLSGVKPIDLAPAADTRAVRAVEMMVLGPRGSAQTFVLVAVRLSGRWLAASVIADSAPVAARELVRIVAESARAFLAFRSRAPRDLKELIAHRAALEASENLKSAGLSYPLGAWLDREREAQGYTITDGDLVGPFYRVRLLENGDATAAPRGPSYVGYRARPTGPRGEITIESARGRVPD